MLVLSVIVSSIACFGRVCLSLSAAVGGIFIFTAQTFLAVISPHIYWKEIANQFFKICYMSLPVVGLMALFTGAVLALQVYTGGSRFNAESIVPSIVALGIVRELGPVLTALMVSSRVSSSIAAEIATMKVTEQIDALMTLSTDPFHYLIAPRFIAATLGVPVLVAVADSLGIMGGMLVGSYRLGFNSSSYMMNTWDFIVISDVTSGLVKAIFFGMIVALMGSYHGYKASRGARGVGNATINAVVSASVLIFTSNYILTEFFFAR